MLFRSTKFEPSLVALNQTSSHPTTTTDTNIALVPTHPSHPHPDPPTANSFNMSKACPTGARRFKIKVPATSANIGPGFDVVGLSLSLDLIMDVSIDA